MADNEKELLYTPDIKPTRHYDTDGAFDKNIYPTPSPSKTQKRINNLPEKLKKEFEVLKRTFINAVPEDVRFIGSSIIATLSKRLDIISPDGKRHYSEEKDNNTYKPEVIETDIDINTNPEVTPKFNIELFPSPIQVDLELEIPKSIVQLIQANYESDQLSLDQYYTTQLQLVLQNYFQNMLTIMSEAGIADIDNLTENFDGDAVTIPSGSNLEHCRDYIVRSQIAREQKTRLFKKTHKTDNTVAHIRAWQAAEKQRERYYTEEYGDSGTYVESHSNALLRSQRTNYNDRYKSAAYAMFKYLDSSIKLTNETLEMIVGEAQAKAHLINNDVNIYASTDANTSATLSGNAEQQNNTSKADTTTDANTPGDKEDGNHSHGKAPNGKYYANNDWDYLANQGLSEEQIKAILDIDAKYTNTENSDSNNNSENKNKSNAKNTSENTDDSKKDNSSVTKKEESK